jgi:hypothetical protein
MSQSMKNSAAVSEIIRVAWWSLRALGCPVGAIEATARLVAYSEVLTGDTLAALRRNEVALLAAYAADEPRFSMTGEASGVIDAGGRSMLDVGPRAIDLMTGLAKRRGDAVRVTVARLADTIGLAGAATVAAQRGIGLVLIDADVRRSWGFYAANRHGDITSLSGQLNDGSTRDLMSMLREMAGEGFPEANWNDWPHSDSRAPELVAFPFTAGDDLAAIASRHAGLACKDVSGALRKAYAQGVEIAAEDLRFLYELETRTWAPSSERSRQQAGFQVAVAASQ